MSKNTKNGLVWFVMFSVVAFAMWQMKFNPKDAVYPLVASDFYNYIQRKDAKGLFDGKIQLGKESIRGKFRFPASVQNDLSAKITQETTQEIFPPDWKGYFETSRDPYSNYPIEEKLIDQDIPFDNEPISNFPQWMVIFGSTVLPILLFLGIMIFISRQMQGTGNRAMSFGRSRAKLYSDNNPETTFEDVAGCDEAKEALEEVVEFLKDPKRFQRLGGRIPKGVLLMGPPGTGKTLLARAVAGEADVPFYSISGSDFVEMFVGVGAARVRDTFETAKKNAPCIIFIDELDAVGRHRGAGIGGGHDEREQTLNQLLVDMDGFDASEGLILIAATNRPDVLDPALLRPGRFDRQVIVDLPTVRGREAIFKVHVAKIKVDDTINLSVLAKATPYFSGADIANMVNESALLAAKEGKDAVDQICLDEAKDRVMMGPERRSMALTENERKITAYHEAGHALLNHFLPESDPNYKCSIIPRGRALGVTVKLPIEERHNFGKKYLLSEISVFLGGRIAEEIMFNEQTTGAQNDFERATNLARKMVTQWGMSDLGPLTFGKQDEQVFLGKELANQKNYSEKTAIEIDQSVREIINECYDRAEEIIKANIEGLERLAEALLEHETLIQGQITDLLNPQPNTA